MADSKKNFATPLLECLVRLTKIHHHSTSPETLTVGLPLVGNELTPDLFVRAAEQADLESKMVDLALTEVHPNLLPVVLLLDNQGAALLLEITADGFAKLSTDDNGGSILVALNDLDAHYSGKAFVVKSTPHFDAPQPKKAGKVTRIKWFWSVVKQSWGVYSEVLIASAFVNLLALATPLFIMNVYDRVVPNYAVATLWVLALGVVIAFLFDFLLRMLRTRFVDNTARNIDARLSAKIFEQLMGMRMSVRPNSVGGLANTVQAFEAFREFITSASITVLVDFPFIILFILFIGLIGGTLFLVPLLLIPIVLGISLLIQAPLVKLVKKSYELAGAKQSTLIETLVGIGTIKTNNAQSTMQRKWEEIVCYAANIGMRLRFLSALGVNFSVFSQYLGSVLVVIIGVYKIGAGTLTVGGLIASTILTGRALAPLVQLASLLMRYYQSVASIKALDDIMNLPVDRPSTKSFLKRDQFKGDIEFKKVTFNYPLSQIPALNNISFKMSPGDHIALIGKVGSGKSTVEKMIVGLYDPSEGNILVDGNDINQLDPIDVRKNIGYVPQDIILFGGSIKDNIVLGDSNANDEAVLHAAKFAGLDHLIGQHPDGINMQVGERGEMLSGGQRQAVAIAQAILHNPPLLVFDEPTTSMDDVTEARFKATLSNALDSKTMILVTHKGSMLSLVNRIIILDNGQIIADGPKDQVLQALREKRIRPASR